MNRFDKNEKAVEAVRKHYECNGKYFVQTFMIVCLEMVQICLIIVMNVVLMISTLDICNVYLIKNVNYEKVFIFSSNGYNYGSMW